MILVITGNGKGKTTSAIGTAIRACGWGKRVAIVFFDKGGSHYGEQNILQFLQGKNLNSKLKIKNYELNFAGIDTFRFGLERFNPKSKNFRFKNTDEDKKEAEEALKKSINLYEENYFMIICDEIINCLNLGLLDEIAVRDFIDKCPSDIHLMLTGRNAPDWLIEKADLVSEINDVKHYFKDGQDAIEGLDF